MADPGIKLTKKEINAAFGRDADSKYPPVLTTEQAHEMLQMSRSTLFEWKAKGRFKGASRRVGGSLRWWRDRVVECFFNAQQ